MPSDQQGYQQVAGHPVKREQAEGHAQAAGVISPAQVAGGVAEAGAGIAYDPDLGGER